MSAVIALSAISALGRGAEAVSAGAPGEPARCAIARDEALAAAGLTRPHAARAALDGEGDRATAILSAAFDDLAGALDARLPGWRDRRVGVSIGTSSGGMLSAERFFARGEAAGEATYFAPLAAALGRAALSPHKLSQVLAACASSTIAIGLGMRWLERGACDLVIAGGYDAVSVFVAAGFEALRAVCRERPQPFRLGRDGMALGEGAGLVALVPDDAPVAPRFFITGFGASSDAVHITAPDREGAGLVRAGRAALDDAACPSARIDLVSAHATATPFNDPAEARAIAALCDPPPPVHPFKAQIGHTLGAAGVLELLCAADALERGLLPAAAGDGPVDPEAAVPLLSRAESRPLRAALKLSAAFGGVTAALVVDRDRRARPPRPSRGVGLVAHAAVDDVDRAWLAEATGQPRDRLARIDELGQLAIAAVATLVARVGRDAIAGAGIVAGYALATLDTNARFHRRLVDKGATRVDPRVFPATTPNAGAGHVAILWGLTGPCFAVGAGLDGGREALAAAAELVAAGDADRMLVVSADDMGPASRAWLAACAPDRPAARGAAAALIVAGEGAPLDADAVMAPTAPLGQLGLLRCLDAIAAAR